MSQDSGRQNDIDLPDNNPSGALPSHPPVTEEQIRRNRERFADVVARYYGDPEFKAKLEANPAQVLLEEGLDIPKGVNVKLLFNSTKRLHMVLPCPDFPPDSA